MSAAGLVDWRLAGGVARLVAQEEGGAPAPGAALVHEVCEEALERVLGYTGLRPQRAVPPATLCGRNEWIAANVEHLRRLAAPLEHQAGAELELPWPLGRLVRGAVGAAAGAEVGVVVGYASRRVVGQYEVALDGSAREPRLLVVGANLFAVADELQVPRERFLLWVAMHEQTHALQFGAVPWLKDHMAALVGRLLRSTARGLDAGTLAGAAKRLVATDPREALRKVLRGELVRALAGPEQAAVLDELQATMAVIEGYAEHAMDAAGSADPELAEMRARLDARRARTRGLAETLARALGLGAKLEQYERGKRFCDAVAAARGIEGLNEVWASPAALPSPAELDAPERWRAAPRNPAAPPV